MRRVLVHMRWPPHRDARAGAGKCLRTAGTAAMVIGLPNDRVNQSRTLAKIPVKRAFLQCRRA
jgi:hypothetical protein